MTADARSTTVLIARALTYGLAVFTSILIARLLGTHERGVWAVALLASGLVALLSELGLGAAVFSLSRQERARRGAVLTVGALLASVSGVVASVLVLFATIHGAIPFVDGVPSDVLVLALGGVVITNLLSMGRQALLEDGDATGNSASQLVQAGSLLVLLLGKALSSGLSTRAAVGAFLTSLLTAFAFTAVRLKGRGLLAPVWDSSMVLPLLRRGVGPHFSTVALLLTFRFDLLLVNRFLGPGAAGLYSVSLSLSEMLRGLPEVGQTIVLARSSAANLVDVVRQTTRLTILLTAIVGGIAAVLATWAIPFVFGVEYGGAVAPFAAIVPGVIGLAVSYCVSPLLLMQGGMRVSAAAAALSFVTMVALDIIVIPRWGLVGAALVSSLAYWLAAMVQLRWIHKTQPLSLGQLRPGSADLNRLVVAAAHLLRRP